MAGAGVGEAAAHALAEGGYGTIGDIVADSSDEVAEKTWNILDKKSNFTYNYEEDYL